MERNKQRQQCFSVWNCRTKQETKTIKQTDKETKNWNVLLQINVHSRVKDYIYGVWSSGVTMALLTVRKTDQLNFHQQPTLHFLQTHTHRVRYKLLDFPAGVLHCHNITTLYWGMQSVTESINVLFYVCSHRGVNRPPPTHPTPLFIDIYIYLFLYIS